MAEYIDREAAITAVKTHCPAKYEVAVLARIVCIPAADVAEVRHGHWVDDEGKFVKLDDDGSPAKEAWCSVCNDWLTASDEYPTRGYYCPNCGAKMDESEEEK